jgi:hypothetical protein
MHRVVYALALALPLIACDPIVDSSFRLAPAATAPGVAAQAAQVPREALAAVEGLARQFGLAEEASDPKSCVRAWRGERYRRGLQQLFLCVGPPTPEGVRARLSELLTTSWTPRGDSLRRALADSVARYGGSPIQ